MPRRCGAEGPRAKDDSRDSREPVEPVEPVEGTFLLTLLPPASAATAMRPGVVVLDRSGSMDGWKMAAARRAAARIVDTLTGADRFAALAFDHTVETAPGLSSGLVQASDRNRFRAVGHLASLDARGGTEMLEPLRRAVALLTEAPPDAAGAARDRVLVLVTDGQVGQEDQILAQLGPGLAGIRVHAIGIDRAVNAAFLRRLADAGGGRCELVESEDRLDEAMEHIHRRIGSPVVVGVRLAGDNLAIVPDSVEPARLPDLFAGAPLVVTGRFTGAAAGSVVVTGTTPDGGAFTTAVPAVATADAGLGPLWARGRIRDLEDRYIAGTGDNQALERDIVATSVRFSVLSRFTAFVAVDSAVVNESGVVKPVTQPVDLPSGWSVGAASAAFPVEPSISAAPPAPMARAAAPARSRPRGLGFAPSPGGRSSLPLGEASADMARRAGGAPLPPPAAQAAPPLPKAEAPAAAAGYPDMQKDRKAEPAQDVFSQFEPEPPAPGSGPGSAYKRRLRQRGILTADEVRRVVEEMIRGLRLFGTLPLLSFNADALQQTADGLEALLDSVTEEWKRRIVEDLIAELRGEVADQAVLELRIRTTLTALEKLFGPEPESESGPEPETGTGAAPEPGRRAFWKR